MSAQNTRTIKVNTLSDRELDAVAGGVRHQVTKETYEKLLWVRYVVSGSK